MAAEVETHSLSPGVRLGAYTLVRPLAVGGMAELYLATPTKGQPHPVALKRMLPHLAWDPEFVRMFLDEVRIIAGLDHPNIVHVLDYGIGDGSHFFAMEYVHGKTVGALQQQWKGPQPLPLSVGVAIVEAVASGLHYAHEPGPERSGLVHRDVSPANVMVAFDGTVKLLDFGIARLSQETQRTRAGTLKGKVGYMSPEQCKGVALDRRSDVFGLGVLLYELAVRRRAFFGDNDFAVMNKVVKGEFVPPRNIIPELPAQLDTLIRDTLRVKPEDRPPTAADFNARLRSWADTAGLDRSPQMLASFLHERFGSVPSPSLNLPVSLDAPTDLSDPLPSPPQRFWRIAAGSGLLVAGFVLGGALMRGSGDEALPEPSRPAALPQPTAPTTAGVGGEAEAKPGAPALPAPPTDNAEEIAIFEDEVPQTSPASRSTKRRKGRRPGKKRRPSKSAETPEPRARPGSSVLPPSWSERDN